jgi:predicted DNA-binding transcriptional regulator YafY
MTKAERLLFICNLLRVRRRVTLEELARECEVSRRTIYRDLLSLSNLNIPVYYDNGYKLARETSLPELNFTEDEQEVLGYCMRSSPLLRSRLFRDIIRTVELKILSAIPGAKGVKKQLNSKLVGSEKTPPEFSDKQDTIITDFMHALINNRELVITLKSSGKEFEGLYPVFLQVHGFKWFLGMTDKFERRKINVPLERIADLKIVEAKPKPFRKPDR